MLYTALKLFEIDFLALDYKPLNVVIPGIVQLTDGTSLDIYSSFLTQQMISSNRKLTPNWKYYPQKNPESESLKVL